MAIPYLDVQDKTDEFITTTYQNIIDGTEIWALKHFRDDILYIADHAPSSQLPPWFKDSLENLVERFLNLFPKRNEPPQKIYPYAVYDGLTYDAPSDYNNNGRLYSIPYLKAYVDILALKGQQATMQNMEELVNKVVSDALPVNQIKAEFETLTEQTRELNKQAEASLAILNKQVGKIGVELYADIFDKQALEHSNLFGSKGTEDGKDIGWGIGKAQIWACFAIIFIVSTVSLFLSLDSMFPVSGGNEYTPEVTLHIIGRIVTISMGIFLVSFAFKQFRVNMHLYTLNKHRANTLKSFEYLSKAPDKLDPASYNAILMKVAESIYDAGQTGYIASSESNNDMPSIIDMTKIITPQSK